MKDLWEKILAPLKGEYSTLVSLVLAAVPLAFINMPMWTLFLACGLIGLLFFTFPAALKPVSCIAYAVALVETVLAPFEWFNVVFYVFLVYFVLCFIAGRKTEKDDEDEYEEDDGEE